MLDEDLYQQQIRMSKIQDDEDRVSKRQIKNSTPGQFRSKQPIMDLTPTHANSE